MRLNDQVTSGINQICHSTGQQHICRGGREITLRYFYALGYIDEPTDESLFKAMKEMGITPTNTVFDENL